MPLTAVTFDFHNTLAVCDEWFELEVRSIVPRFLEWYQSGSGVVVPDDTRAEAARLYRALREDIMLHGLEHDAATCTQHTLGLLGIPIPPHVVARGVDDIMRGTLRGAVPVGGAIDTVRELRSNGIPLAVVSSAAHHPFLEWSLAKFDILDAFEFIGSSATIGYYKSNGRIYERVLERLGRTPEEVVHVGDSHRYDVESPGKVGMRTVWLDHGVGMGNHAADLRVTTLEGLAPLLLDRSTWSGA